MPSQSGWLTAFEKSQPAAAQVRTENPIPAYTARERPCRPVRVR